MYPTRPQMSKNVKDTARYVPEYHFNCIQIFKYKIKATHLVTIQLGLWRICLISIGFNKSVSNEYIVLPGVNPFEQHQKAVVCL